MKIKKDTENMRPNELLPRFLVLVVLGTIFLAMPVLAGGGGHGSHELNWFDFTHETTPPILGLLINFACLAVILYFMLRKSMSARFKGRREALETALTEANEAKGKAEKALAEARSKIDRIEQEMEQISEEILEAGRAESARVMENAESQAERMRADAKAMVEHEIARMTQGIRERITDEVVAMAESIVKEKIGRADHDRLAREYLEGIVTDSSPTSAES